MSRLVIVVAFDGAQLLDVAGPVQTFASANDAARGLGGRLSRTAAYEVAVVSPHGGLVRTSSGVALSTQSVERIASRRPLDTIIVAGGRDARDPAAHRALVGWLGRRARRARRICSVCTGAFLLAEAGLLSGRRATTHWQACGELEARYPGVRVQPDLIFVRDGPVWTSAGVTAGIDLTLALVEDDLGHAVAMEVARELVVFLKRPGGQAQFSVSLASQAASDDRFAALHAWMVERLEVDLRVERLAERCGMSARHFARVYAARVGRTPARTVELMRVEAARAALEDSRAPIKRVAATAGFGTEQRLRRAFLRQLGVTPTDYRDRFARAARADRGRRR